MTVNELINAHERKNRHYGYKRTMLPPPPGMVDEDEPIVYLFVCASCGEVIYRGPFADNYGTIPA